eukprot:gnl/Chilomastix_cuspidata/1011.p1 GENE.gnl/Chilomastix_cuspidata/1011~~gnl/Chilomastix_cuspidata/1011.p1  ORF type:complete len:632 (+),score=242.44 gnl/Chilomastix_cuspidata/1011:68-1963(+)
MSSNESLATSSRSSDPYTTIPIAFRAQISPESESSAQGMVLSELGAPPSQRSQDSVIAMHQLFCDCGDEIQPLSACPCLQSPEVREALKDKYIRMQQIFFSLREIFPNLRSGEASDAAEPRAPQHSLEHVNYSSALGSGNLAVPSQRRGRRGRGYKVDKHNNELLRLYWAEAARLFNRFNLRVLGAVARDPCPPCRAFVEATGAASPQQMLEHLQRRVTSGGCPRCLPGCHLVSSIANECDIMGRVAGAARPDYGSAIKLLLSRERLGAAPPSAAPSTTSEEPRAPRSESDLALFAASVGVCRTGARDDGAHAHQDAPAEAAADAAAKARPSRMPHVTVNISFFSNVFLMALKIVAYAMSHSMVVLASTLDSVLDVLSGAILVGVERITARQARVDYLRYPVGKQRAQVIGILIFSCIMASFALQIITSAVVELFGDATDITFTLWPRVIIAVTVALKLALFLLARTVARRHASEECAAYAQDHFNDVLSNSTGFVFGVLAEDLRWWIDPAGSIAISLYIFVVWVRSAFVQTRFLAGCTASAQLKSVLTFIAINFDDRIQSVDYVEAFHVGSQVIVDIHVIFPGATSLDVSQAIVDALRAHIEQMAEVEKCFIHVDINPFHRNPRTGVDGA